MWTKCSELEKKNQLSHHHCNNENKNKNKNKVSAIPSIPQASPCHKITDSILGAECYHKITDSILGAAFLSISMFYSSKILPNIMQIKVVSIYLVHH